MRPVRQTFKIKPRTHEMKLRCLYVSESVPLGSISLGYSPTIQEDRRKKSKLDPTEFWSKISP
jgi:hypothetical protein